MRIMIVAGEASGDLHAAKLVRALRKASPERVIDFFGAAGPQMRESGVEPTVFSDELSVVGLPEIARALPMFLGALRRLETEAKKRTPDAAVLVDFPDFNLKLARRIKRLDIPVIYYISPQLWAWRGHRIASVKKYVDVMITILPFEKEWYEARGVKNVEYVGSPLAREVHAEKSKEEFCAEFALNSQDPIVTLLPGSRRKEISRILPVMRSAAELVAKTITAAQFIIAVAGATDAAHAKEIIASKRSTILPRIVAGQTYSALNAADAAAITSGTATLEAAIIGTPMAVVYKTSKLNYATLRPLISVEHFGLVNLIAGKRIATELIQDEFTDETLAEELLKLLDKSTNSAMRDELKTATDKLGHGGASKRAAEAIIKLINTPSA